jgi:hypothetical protein
MFCCRSLKEIAKLRGSEELWEVAKLHDREASFPLVNSLFCGNSVAIPINPYLELR